jgi:hypothetical protein
VKNYVSAIIVSEEVKRRFEMAGLTGMRFKSVNGEQKTVA